MFTGRSTDVCVIERREAIVKGSWQVDRVAVRAVVLVASLAFIAQRISPATWA
jgi:hypothetical protein